MPNCYDTMTDSDFDRVLRDVLNRTGCDLLSIPGVYAIVSEHYQSEVLAAWDQTHGAERRADVAA